MCIGWDSRYFRPTSPALIMLGSGDTTWDYVQLFCLLVLSVAATGVWSLLDRKRLNYDRLHLVLRTIVRFWLAYNMIVYGTAKIIPVQMPSPTLERLLEPFGDASPMGLLWTFMGASAGYTMFTRAAELLGGLLLIARRTTLLGALVCCGVMANVVMLNFCYDVPVKLASSHLLVMAIFLIVPDLRRGLGDLFLFQRQPALIEIRPLFTGKVAHRAASDRPDIVLYRHNSAAAGDVPFDVSDKHYPAAAARHLERRRIRGGWAGFSRRSSRMQMQWRRVILNYPGNDQHPAP